MKRFPAAVAALVASALAAPSALSNGFLIYDLSGEAIGRASAVSAVATEPAAVWFNPAALPFLDGAGASIGGVFVTARSHFEHEDTGAETSSERGNFVLPTLFAHAKVSDDVALGMGVYSAFGIGIRWPDAWVGRENAVAASLQTLAFNPAVAVRVHPRLALAAGVSAVRSTVDFENGLPALVGGQVRLAGGGWGFGANAGLLYRPIPERLQLALTYRSRVALHFDGKADFDPANPDFARDLRDESGSADITLPDIVTAGVLVGAAPELALTFDVNLVFWTTYDRIDIDFASAPDRSLRPHGRNAFMIRAGADWSTPAPGFHLRGGLIFDRGAIPDEGRSPSLPDSDRIDVTTGLGYERGRWKADAGYMLVCFLPAEAKTGRESPEGTYRTLAHLLGVTLGAAF